jgi:hypothetical protein
MGVAAFYLSRRGAETRENFIIRRGFGCWHMMNGGAPWRHGSTSIEADFTAGYLYSCGAAVETVRLVFPFIIACFRVEKS